MNDRIDYACGACGKRLSAPVAWAGRGVACPVCGNADSVPAESDAYAGRDAGQDALPRRFDQAAPEIVFANPVRKAAVTLTKTSRPGFFRRYRFYIISFAVVVALLGWWASWRWYYHHYVKAESIMKNRGYGTQLSAPLTSDPRVDALVGAVTVAETRQFASPDDLELTISLAAAYDAVLKEISHVSKARGDAIMNNAAWLYSTTPHLGLRDHERALSLARSAVVSTCRHDATYLDTLAEALTVNGRKTEALDVAREALKLDPANAYLKEREQHFIELNQ